ncbi:hypothetical protein GJ496_003749 [Pomphorhynchus laevis]|nr:hypothetical protein GJ496_003749 [Pomphorhynchus laevis]
MFLRYSGSIISCWVAFGSVYQIESINGSICSSDIAESDSKRQSDERADLIEQIIILADTNKDAILNQSELLDFLQSRIDNRKQANLQDLCRDIGDERNPRFMGYFLARYGQRSGSLLDDIADSSQYYNFPLSIDHTVTKSFYNRDYKKWQSLRHLPCKKRVAAIISGDWTNEIFASSDLDNDNAITMDEFYYSSGLQQLWHKLQSLSPRHTFLTRKDMSKIRSLNEIKPLVKSIFPFESLPIDEAKSKLIAKRAILNAITSNDNLPRYYHGCADSTRRSYDSISVSWDVRPLDTYLL